MRSITAVEIGADTCALASTSVHGSDLRVTAAETLDPAAFPGIEAFTLALQQTRVSLKLSRRCRAVVWGLPDGAARNNPIVAPLIEPLTRAGFKVSRVVTPCNALGALARLRTSRAGGAMCWLGVNRNGVAVVVIRPGQLLYSHSFAWNSNIGATGSQARLLQRYSLVSFLAPEVRRAIAAAKQKGATVDGIVTCGNLPDLRALTMPLIEELDIEVETLDSLEGLVMKAELSDKLSEVAPAIRLACAGAFARETRSVDESQRLRVRRTSRAVRVLGAAALVALAAAGGYWWYTSRPAATARPAPPTPAPAKAAVAMPKEPTPATSVAAPSPVPSKRESSVVIPPKTGNDSASPGRSVSASAARPTVPAPNAPVSVAPTAGSTPTKSPSTPSAPAPKATPALNAPPRPIDKPETAAAGRGAPTPLPEVLKDPVPRVTAILVAADRRLATIGDDGQVVAVGDTIGRRVVVAIDDRTVLLREPSGVQIRVALGGGVVGVTRSDR
jgi:hypothetical protein